LKKVAKNYIIQKSFESYGKQNELGLSSFLFVIFAQNAFFFSSYLCSMGKGFCLSPETSTDLLRLFHIYV